jgi:hypothetical protein
VEAELQAYEEAIINITTLKSEGRLDGGEMFNFGWSISCSRDTAPVRGLRDRPGAGSEGLEDIGCTEFSLGTGVTIHRANGIL